MYDVTGFHALAGMLNVCNQAMLHGDHELNSECELLSVQVLVNACLSVNECLKKKVQVTISLYVESSAAHVPQL